jgi:hypothetical protein
MRCTMSPTLVPIIAWTEVETFAVGWVLSVNPAPPLTQTPPIYTIIYESNLRGPATRADTGHAARPL